MSTITYSVAGSTSRTAEVPDPIANHLTIYIREYEAMCRRTGREALVRSVIRRRVEAYGAGTWAGTLARDQRDLATWAAIARVGIRPRLVIPVGASAATVMHIVRLAAVGITWDPSMEEVGKDDF